MYITLLVLKDLIVEPWTCFFSDKPAVKKRLSMLTNTHVTVSTRVGTVVRHNHKEWLLVSMAVYRERRDE